MANRSDKPCGGCGNHDDPNLATYTVQSTFDKVAKGELFYAVAMKRVMLKTEVHGCCPPNDNARCPVSGMLALFPDSTKVRRKPPL